MKAILAVFLSILIFILCWLAIAAILYIIQLMATYARPGLGLFHFIHTIFTWLVGPCFGAFSGIYASARIFSSVSILTIRSSFVTAVIIITVLMFLFSLVFDASRGNLFDVFILAAQIGAVVFGAKLGKDWYNVSVKTDRLDT